MKQRIQQVAPFIVLVVLAVAALIYLGRVSGISDGLLEASGTIEAEEITLASEFGGLVVEVLADEGDQVISGQVLVRFDDAYLAAQYKQAQANLAQAQANLDQVSAVAALERLEAQQALDDLYNNAELARAQAQMDVVSARDALGRAQNEGLVSSEVEVTLTNLQQLLEDLKEDREAYDYQRCKQSTADQAYAEFIMAQEALEDEQKEFDDYYAHKAEDDLSRAVALSKLSDAKHEFDRAQANLNWCTDKADELDIAEIEAQIHQTEALILEAQRELDTYENPAQDISKTDARVEQAQALLDEAQQELEKLQDGPDPDAVALLEARVEAVDSRLSVAESQVDIALAALDALQVQLDKLMVEAPVASTIQTATVDPGEIVAPGVPLMTLVQLDELTIAVYLPEDRYGEINLGDRAQVTVDSFPGVRFDGLVIRIADQAEFTPRNVATEDGRRTTVFAVKIAIVDAQGRLKPGMPADVNFLRVNR